MPEDSREDPKDPRSQILLEKGLEASRGMNESMREATPWIDAVWRITGGALFGVGTGYFIDAQFGTKPWGLLGMSLLGTGVGFYGFLKVALAMGHKPPPLPPKDGGNPGGKP